MMNLLSVVSVCLAFRAAHCAFDYGGAERVARMMLLGLQGKLCLLKRFARFNCEQSAGKQRIIHPIIMAAESFQFHHLC